MKHTGIMLAIPRQPTYIRPLKAKCSGRSIQSVRETTKTPKHAMKIKPVESQKNNELQ